MQSVQRVVIIGGGFGGLAAAHQLKKKKNVEVLLIDRNNFHTFTPLLYQVATCALGPAEIARPIRGILRRHPNIQFLLGEVKDIQQERKQVVVHSQGDEYVQRYDYLIIAAGSVTNFFGNEEIAMHSFGLKDLHDTMIMRNHILKMFEKAAWTKDSIEREAMTTMVVVGGGPTGLETAGALYELYNHVLAKEYNRSNGIRARVVLVEATDTLLRPYPERLREAARRQLESLGVEVVLGQAVESVDRNRVTLTDGETIHTKTLVWAAGVQGSPLSAKIGVKLQRGNRIPVEETMQVVGQDQIYAIGDIAYLQNEEGQPYPQVIPVAQQQGKLAAKNALRRMEDKEQKLFKYNDRGMMATIGRSRAVAYPFYKIQLTGYLAWATWLVLHLIWLMGFRNRLNVFIHWVWNYFTYDRSVRIILDRIERRGYAMPQDYEEAEEEAA
jgi:NADH dehydrogenase